jgi:hypothetical protein
VKSQTSTAPTSFGPFDLLETLGRGGNAIVYKACHRVTGEIVALKVGLSTLKLEPGALERFQQEFKAIFPLRHPSVVRALALGDQDGVPYLVLEYVPGQDLAQLVEQKGALTAKDAAAIFRQLADGLRFLHANHILHRDIKPRNILLASYNQAKLADFGLLKNLNEEPCLTVSRKAMGTIDYGAPEQFEDAKRADRRCDLYSLAASLYTALTGKFPFGNGNHLQILQRKLLGQLVPLRLLLPSLDPAIDQLVSRCLQPHPNQRPDSCDEFIAVLDRSAAWCAPPVAPADDVVLAVAGPATRERRATVRFAVDLTTLFVPFHETMRGRWQAAILDVSAGGVCLQTSRPVAVHSVLQIMLGNGAAPVLALVRWVKPGPAETFLVGCAFVRTLQSQEVEAIRRSESGKTARRKQGATNQR